LIEAASGVPNSVNEAGLRLAVINLGNSRITAATFEGDEIRLLHTLPLSEISDDEQAWRQALGFERWGNLKAVIVGSVNPPLERLIMGYLRGWTDVPLFCIGENLEIPMKVAVREPSTVGVDRLANALAAYEIVKGALLVLDFGTAVTFDYVSEAGTFEGGLIFPGIRIAALSLREHTAKLPLVNPGESGTLIGRDTSEAIRAGIYWGYRALTERLIEMIRSHLEVPVRLVATGGDAEMIIRDIRHPFLHRPFLTLEGLRLAFLKHRGG